MPEKRTCGECAEWKVGCVSCWGFCQPDDPFGPVVGDPLNAKHKDDPACENFREESDGE